MSRNLRAPNDNLPITIDSVERSFSSELNVELAAVGLRPLALQLAPRIVLVIDLVGAFAFALNLAFLPAFALPLDTHLAFGVASACVPFAARQTSGAFAILFALSWSIRLRSGRFHRYGSIYRCLRSLPWALPLPRAWSWGQW